MGAIIYAVVSSGSKVSGDIDLTKGQLGMIRVPTVTSGDLYVQGGLDTTSANFGRLFSENGAIYFPTGPGSCVALWPMGELTPAYVRAEFSVTQTDNRTLSVLRY